MSVFSDFQRMWMMRFPDNSLSSEWEQDVKSSLHRHKQKISDLSKELEQEMLYVAYLEKLLADVEQFRSNGGDPIALLGYSKDTGVSGTVVTSMKTINNEDDIKTDDIGNANALEGCSDEIRKIDGDDDGAIHENNVTNNDNSHESRDEVSKLNLIDFNLKLRFFFHYCFDFFFLFSAFSFVCVILSRCLFNLCKCIFLEVPTYDDRTENDVYRDIGVKVIFTFVLFQQI